MEDITGKLSGVLKHVGVSKCSFSWRTGNVLVETLSFCKIAAVALDLRFTYFISPKVEIMWHSIIKMTTGMPLLAM